MSIIISADEIKKQIPSYSPARAEEFHHESAKQADKMFSLALKDPSLKKVILLSGGTASGKTEFLLTQLIEKNCIIMDATLSTELGAKNKIRQIIKAGKTPIIYFVMPKDLITAFIAFLNRDRKFSDAHFYKTHSGSRKTVAWLASTYPEIEINIIESSYTPEKKLQFAQLIFETKQKLNQFLTSMQKTERDIITLIDKDI